MEFASKGVAGAALGTGIAGLALGVLNGGLGGLVGNGNGLGRDININAPDVEVARLRGYGYGPGAINVAAYGGWGGYGCGPCGYGDHLVNRYELNLNQQINAKDAIITGQASELFTTREIGKVYGYVNEQVKELTNRICYDEKQIDKAFCEIEKTNINLRDNYIAAHKVLRPWDMCPQPLTACGPFNHEGRHEGFGRDCDDNSVTITKYFDAAGAPTTAALAVKTVVIKKSKEDCF